MRQKHRLTRRELLAAEIYAYSYDNYEAHMGIGHIRFEELMPADADVLEKADREGWEPSRLAQALDLPEDRVAFLQDSYRQAQEIVDAPTLVQSFRRGVRFSIEYALEQGLGDTASMGRCSWCP